MDVPTWYGMTVTGKLQPTLAGWWLGCVSLPLVQFILLRWYFRLLIWTRFLWQVSRIDLRLVAIHPDRRRRLGLSFPPSPMPSLPCWRARGCCSPGEPSGISDAHCDDGKRFVVHADEMLTTFLQLERIPREPLRFLNAE
jgi:hypothetical protein